MLGQKTPKRIIRTAFDWRRGEPDFQCAAVFALDCVAIRSRLHAHAKKDCVAIHGHFHFIK